ncbi:MAG TPA: SpoIID/LytB domain-containing protein, partial [Thermoanaerobaculia bacterium]|nr:SpoIID/LytB domain-containing protein [Thermoanaerobaculia bacterium]
QYLRGVVPRELGPGQYPELEALKAQAVAARSYTVRNLGGFSGEGYDLCAKPQCQVYGGMDDEHALSDRAVAETAGEIVTYGGEPVDALYTATCGGHTEDVEVVFPLRTAPYLRGVPCLEAGGTRLAGGATGVDRLDALLGLALPSTAAAGRDAAGLGDALTAVVRAAGVEPPPDRLLSLERREVQRFLASQLDLAADARLFVRDEELDYLVADPPRDWTREDRRFAAWLAQSRLLDGDRRVPLDSVQARELVLRVSILLRVVEEREASFAALAGGRLRVREADGARDYPVTGELATFRDQGGALARGELLLLPGDSLRLDLRGDRLAGVVQRVDVRGAAFDRGHERSSWTRFKSDEELARLVRARYPGFALADFEIVSRGASGRVGRLRLRDAAGASLDLEGLAIRWTLDLPDTLFTARRLAPREGAAGWSFTGRGWGHGVGMCQTGAFGMARRGYGYRQILGHYYSGVSVERLAAALR